MQSIADERILFVEPNDELLRRFFSFCEPETAMEARRSSRHLDEAFGRALMSDIGKLPSDADKWSLTDSFTDGFRCREGGGGVTTELEGSLALTCVAVSQMNVMNLRKLLPTTEQLCGEGSSTQKIEQICSSLASCEVNERELKSFYRMMSEWLRYIGKLHRAHFNLQHGLFNYLSLESDTRPLLLPDGTLCLTSECDLLFCSKRRNSTCCSGWNKKNHQKDTSFAATWEEEERYSFDSKIVCMFRNSYSGSLYVTTAERGTSELVVITPRMHRMQSCIDNNPPTSSGYVFIEKPWMNSSSFLSVRDSIGLENYRWSAMQIQKTIDQINSSQSVQHDSKEIYDHVHLIYNNVEVTARTFPQSKKCHFSFSDALSHLYRVAEEEIIEYLEGDVSSTPTPSETNARSKEELQKQDVTNHFIFTSFPSSSLIVSCSEVGTHVSVAQVSVKNESMHSEQSDHAQIFSLSPFKGTSWTGKSPKCRKHVLELQSGVPAPFFTPQSLSSDLLMDVENTTEECECLLLATREKHSVTLLQMKLRRCSVVKIGRHINSSYVTEANGERTVHFDQTWFVLRDYWYFSESEITALKVFSHTLNAVTCTPRPWLPLLMERRAQTKQVGTIRLGSNDMSWRPQYDGHPYFDKPFLLLHLLYSDIDKDSVFIGWTPEEGETTLESRNWLVSLPALTCAREALPRVTRCHANRYMALLNGVCAACISPTNAFFVLATSDGRLLLAAPWLSEPDSYNVSPNATGDEQRVQEGSSVVQSDAVSNDCSTSVDLGHSVGFAGTTGWRIAPRHYKSSSFDSYAMAEEDESEPSATSRVSTESVFGSLFQSDSLLRKIQVGITSITDQWDRQMRCKTEDNNKPAPTSLTPYLRLPLYMCFLRAERTETTVRKIHLDDSKLTTVSTFLDVMIFDLSQFFKSATKRDNGVGQHFPGAIPLFSVGLFSEPIVRATLTINWMLREVMTSPTDVVKLQLLWSDGLMLMSATKMAVTYAFLLDFSPFFKVPEELTNEVPVPPCMENHHGSLPMSATSSQFGAMLSLKKKRNELLKKFFVYVRVATEEIKKESLAGETETSVMTSSTNADYYPLDFFACCSDERQVLTYDEFLGSQRGTRFHHTALIAFSYMASEIMVPPHFQAYEILPTLKIWFPLLHFISVTMLVVYVLLNSKNLSSKATIMPYWCICFFTVPFFSLLFSVLCVSWSRNPLLSPWYKLSCALQGIRFALWMAAVILFALKHDKLLPETLKWWMISLLIVASALANAMKNVLLRLFREKGSLILFPMPYYVLSIVLLSFFFDYSSPSNPEKGIFPLVVAVTPLFLFAAILFFSIFSTFFSYPVYQRIVAFVILLFLAAFVFFPLIIFIAEFSIYWRWKTHPEAFKKPSCFVPLVLYCSAFECYSLVAGFSWAFDIVTLPDYVWTAS